VELRVGQGYDVHPLRAGRRLVLGGVEIAHERGLDGHSDADVLVHAIMDAVLGGAGLGDIGRHFPPSEERWRDASSLDLLAHVAALVDQRGWRTVNVDATVIAERPRIAPHVASMREHIAAGLSVSVDAVGIKATTNERLGALGREEGIAALAVALLMRE
jgi:2-C-methyl-D-erythritol 2,4-cyclodiphosphate synthase